MAEIQAAFTQSAPLETRESVPYLNDLIFFLKRKVEMFQGIRAPPHQNFRIFVSDGRWFSLTHPVPQGGQST